MPLLPTCCTCASLLADDKYIDSKTEKPLHNRNLPCCGRTVCARCIDSNPRFATYCPFCQTTRLDRAPVASSANPPQLPPYTASSAEEVFADQTIPPSECADTQNAPVPPRTPPPSYTNIGPVPLQPQRDTQASAQQSSAPQTAEADSEEDVAHFLAPNDTLHSLSLAYGVPLPVMRMHNRLHADHLLSARRKVFVPRSHYQGPSLSPRPVEGEEESERKANLKRFMVRCKCSDYKYAALYLEEQGWDLDRAVARWMDDEKWEKENPIEKGKGQLKIRR